ncbi:hypothetical protein ANOM_004258 [Aspergillus nomiae NRRL 13137]|uniref:Uncharacterized protein n=1 Tax=Aspergillus nomiae NRRL (strain ATCC 15546 / NRRL 13137 / CBS 260.88 / M93) TaxID=1509407 RepID=A0A0L1J6L4_ASPN3|nr:uncharacterized protein ANOM_004258 [Aspergillus nomiae NRRL 13137]KNG87436.1 hypothetical protein ANOM_004258 [Aspergillus nomiae NRRL 13137]
MWFRFKPTNAADRFPLGKYPSQSETPIVTHDLDDPTRNQGQVCQWGIGWKTTLILCGSFSLALALAITHALVFNYLDGKLENDRNIPSQTYVTAASTIVANVISFCIRICLAAAFTQYFWHIVRISPMRLETLEFLYTMRGSPTSFFSLTVLQKGWLLAIITMVLWAVPVAMSFPSSSMTVRSAIRTHEAFQTEMPGMNLSETWGGNATILKDKELALFVPNNWRDQNHTDFVEVLRAEQLTIADMGFQIKPVIYQLATETIVNGAPHTMSSPCGVNCSYEISFDGPYLSCNNTDFEKVSPQFNRSAIWFYALESNWTTPDAGSLALQNFQMKNAEVYNWVRNDSADTVRFEYVSHVLTCTPRRAEYHVIQRFHNGEQSSTVTIGDVHDLVPMDKKFYFSKNNMTQAVVDTIRDRNIMALIMAMTKGISGNVGAMVYVMQDNLLVQSTRLFNGFSDSWEGTLTTWYSLFTVNEEILNSMLANVTISAINHFQLWPTSVNVTRQDLHTQYVWSRPLNLLLPYFLSLGVALPLAALGYWSLRQNGVAATDNGFLQVAMTTRGNYRFDQLAMGGCLGGNHNESTELKNLEVQFGELVQQDRSRLDTELNDPGYHTTDVRLAGFGPKDEVVPLVIGARYGQLSDDRG